MGSKLNPAAAQRISYRIAAESLLLAEERWILESLKKIKNQRNCLQIERLHLESLKSNLGSNKDTEGDIVLPTPLEESIPAVPETYYMPSTTTALEPVQPMPSTSTVNLMQTQGKITGSQIIEFDTNFMDTEAFCNEQELNLDVTNSVFTDNVNTTFNIEENEEEDDDDDEPDDVAIDMDLLMNGASLDD